jgi:transposase-like protein
MSKERDSMRLNEGSGFALEDEERSDEASRAPAATVRAPVDSEVIAKPIRRQFSASYRRRIVEEADRCTESGEVGQLLRREGLYSAHLSTWRQARREGSRQGLASKKRGAKPKPRDPRDAKVRELETKVARLGGELHKAHTILDMQAKMSGLLGFSLKDGSDC